MKLIILYSIIKVNSKKKKKKSFKEGEKINIISGTVNSFKTQIPYDLYYLDVCAPEDDVLIDTNLGERLISGKLYKTGFQLSINQNKKCEILCYKKVSKKAFKRINNLIKKEYFINYFLDNLPAGQAHTNFEIRTINLKYNTGGVPLGFTKDNKTFINNYFRIIIELNKVNMSIIQKETKDDDEKIVNITGYDIIGFSIEPFSIKMNESKMQN